MEIRYLMLGISVHYANTDADFITVSDILALAKAYPVIIMIHFCVLVKKSYSFSLASKKEKH